MRLCRLITYSACRINNSCLPDRLRSNVMPRVSTYSAVQFGEATSALHRSNASNATSPNSPRNDAAIAAHSLRAMFGGMRESASSACCSVNGGNGENAALILCHRSARRMQQPPLKSSALVPCPSAKTDTKLHRRGSLFDRGYGRRLRNALATSKNTFQRLDSWQNPICASSWLH